MIQITYIFHSCFMVSATDCTVLFDFWKDPDGKLPDLISREKTLYVVVSHFHKDHFSKEIFHFAENHPDVRYIFSPDTAKRSKFFFSPTSTHSGPHIDIERLTVLRKGEEYSDSRISIRAFGSTDIGNSYLLNIDGNLIFHAGDLNAWVWKDESSENEIASALASYRKELISLSSYLSGKRIDAAMFPVDSRIGTDYWEGARIFLETFNVVFFLPMHFGLGTEEEQLHRRMDAAHYELYRAPDKDTVFAGPFAPYGSLSFL